MNDVSCIEDTFRIKACVLWDLIFPMCTRGQLESVQHCELCTMLQHSSRKMEVYGKSRSYSLLLFASLWTLLAKKKYVHCTVGYNDFDLLTFRLFLPNGAS